MDSPLVFVSFDVELMEAERARFIEQRTSCPVGFTVNAWSHQPEAPLRDWERLVRGRVGASSIMIVLVGKETAAAVNVEKEIEFAKSTNVPYFGVYVDSADEKTELPKDMPRNRTIPSDWQRIGNAILQLAGEGKHHTFH